MSVGDPCLDCDSDMRLVELGPNLTVLQVLHDDTCPTFRAMRRNDG